MSKRMGLDRQTVIEAAARLANEIGFEHLTLARLAQELGVRTPSLYNHIEGLDGLRQALSLYIWQKFLNALKDALVNRSGEVAIYAIADTYRAFAHEHHGLYHLIYQSARLENPQLQQLHTTTLQLITDALAYLIGEQNPDIIPILRGFRSLMHGFVSLELQQEFRLQADVTMSYHWIVAHFLSGFTNNRQYA